MIFGVFEFFQKMNERILLTTMTTCFCSFFGRNRRYQKSFRNYLAFRKHELYATSQLELLKNSNQRNSMALELQKKELSWLSFCIYLYTSLASNLDLATYVLTLWTLLLLKSALNDYYYLLTFANSAIIYGTIQYFLFKHNLLHSNIERRSSLKREEKQKKIFRIQIFFRLVIKNNVSK